jgi:uncharacterized coiled-coil DUF342 family protein
MYWLSWSGNRWPGVGELAAESWAQWILYIRLRESALFSLSPHATVEALPTRSIVVHPLPLSPIGFYFFTRLATSSACSSFYCRLIHPNISSEVKNHGNSVALATSRLGTLIHDQASITVTKKRKFVDGKPFNVDLKPSEAQLPVEHWKRTRIGQRVVSDPNASYECSSTGVKLGDGNITIEKDEGSGFWDRISNLEKDMKELRGKNEELCGKNEELCGKNEELSDQVAKISEEGKGFHDKNEELSDQVAKLSEEGKEFRDKNEELSDQVAKLSEEGKEFRDKNEELSDQVAKLSEEGKEFRDKNEELSDQVAKLSEEGKEFRDKNEELRDKNEELSDQVAKLSEEGKEFRDKNEELRQKVGELGGAVRSLQLSNFFIDMRTVIDAVVLKCRPDASSRDDRLSILLDSIEADKLLRKAKVTLHEVLDLYVLIPRAGEAAHSFDANRMREALLVLRQDSSQYESMKLSSEVIKTIESLFLCLVGVQNLDEVLPPTSLVSATYADWKRDLTDKSTMIRNSGLNILKERHRRESIPSREVV